MRINLKFVLTALAALMMLAGCKKEDSPAGGGKSDAKISFAKKEVTLFEGEKYVIAVNYEEFERGVYVKKNYDFAANPMGISIVSSSDAVTVDFASATLTAVKEGSATVSLKTASGAVNSSLAVTVKKNDVGPAAFSQDMSQGLTKDMLLLPCYSAAMQSFDIDKRGDIYISTERNNAMSVVAINKDGSAIGSDMLLPTCGHGDCFCIEQEGSDVYFWTNGTLGDRGDGGGYSGGKANDTAVHLICRYKFTPGATKYAEEADECFYINDNGCRMVDVDMEHDVMMCWTYDSQDYIYVYKFSDIRKAPKVTKKVSRTSYNQGKSVEAYNLSALTPICKYSWKRMGVATGSTNSGAVQGMCIYDDKIYVDSGKKDDAATLISVLNFKGELETQLLPVGVSANKNTLMSLNVSGDGNFEPEGLHIRKGVMYLGFVGDFPKTAATKRSCIIKLK